MKNRIFIFVIISMSLLILGACSHFTAQSTASAPVVSDIQVTIQPDNPEFNYRFSTSEPGKTTVHGTLVVRDPSGTVPADEDPIYLVSLDGQDQTVMSIPGISDDNSIRAEVDERTGEFNFVNVPKGTYALVVITRGEAQITATDMVSSNFVIVKVTDSETGKTIDLKTVSIP